MNMKKFLYEKREQWIQKAIKRPGALKAKAKKAGQLNPDGTIKKSWLKKQAEEGSGRTEKQAELALTLAKLRKRKG